MKNHKVDVKKWIEERKHTKIRIESKDKSLNYIRSSYFSDKYHFNRDFKNSRLLKSKNNAPLSSKKLITLNGKKSFDKKDYDSKKKNGSKKIKILSRHSKKLGLDSSKIHKVKSSDRNKYNLKKKITIENFNSETSLKKTKQNEYFTKKTHVLKSSKIKILSIDKNIKKTKKKKSHLLIKKNFISKLPEKSKKKSKVLKNYLLNKVVHAKARSIDMKNEIEPKKMKGHRMKGNFHSEDKDKTNFINNSKKEIFGNYNKKPLFKLEKDKPSEREMLKNNYYRYLKKKMKKNKLTQELIRKIKKKFRNWKKNEHAEFFNFKTDIGFYKIIQQIGKGCFGKVYLALQILTGTYVALKIIQRKNLKNKKTMKKIKKEVDILKRVNDNNFIIKLFEVFQDEQYVYLVFEFAEKGDLVHHFKKNHLLEEKDLKVFFSKLLLGVKYLHKNNILHRDLKLDNILLDKSMNPKICDFGISSIFNPKKKIYDTGGTPAYLAPEVIKAEGEVCFKTDIWSLGVLLFLLSTGAVPFKANDLQVLYDKILKGNFNFPPDEDLSENIKFLIKNMILLDMNRRFSVQEILKHRWVSDSVDLNKILESKKKKKLSLKEIEKIKAINWYLEELGFETDFIEQSINKNLFNHVKACRDSLYFKFNLID